MLEINFNEDKIIWDKFVAESPQRSIFVYSKFLDSLKVKYDLVTCYDQSQIVAGAPIIFLNDEPIVAPFHFTQYQGIILKESAKKQYHSMISHEFKIIEFFIEGLLKKYHQGCFGQSWRFTDLRPFQWHNYHEANLGQFKIDLRYTGIINLQDYSSFEQYFSSIRDVRKQEFKKTKEILKIIDSTDIELLNQLHNQTFSRQGLEKSDFESSLVKSIASAALSGGYGSLKIAMLNEQAIATTLFLFDDRTAYYLFGASDPEFRKYTAGTAILLDLIKGSFNKGLSEVDVVGVNSPNRGDYKLSFNAQLKPYFINRFKLEK